MEISRIEMSEILKNVKRLYSSKAEKNRASVTIDSDGGQWIWVVAENSEMKVEQRLKRCDEGLPITINTDPFALSEAFESEVERLKVQPQKEKKQLEKTLFMVAEDGIGRFNNNPKSFKYTACDSVSRVLESGFVPFEHYQEISGIFKDAVDVLGDSKEMCSNYLFVSEDQAMMMHPKQMYYYKLSQPLPLKSAVLSKKVLSYLKTTCKEEPSHRYNEGTERWEWRLEKESKEKDRGYIYVFSIKIDSNVSLPKRAEEYRAKYPELTPLGGLRLLLKDDPVEEVYSLRIDAAVLLKKLSQCSCDRLYVSEKEGGLFFDPKQNDDFFKLEDVEITGVYENIQLPTKSLKTMLEGCSGVIDITCHRFTNAHGKTGYSWRTGNASRLVRIAGKEMHDYQKIEQELKKERLIN